MLDESPTWIWRRCLKPLVLLKFAVLALACLGAFTHPHIIRQVDTMGVSLRYWLRWTVEPATPWPLLPAVLTAGDTTGITPTEFPLMNLLYAPFFALPIDIARTAAWLAHLAVCAGLSYVHFRVWRDRTIFGVSAAGAAMLLPLVSITAVFLHRFMPDFLAFMLLSTAIGLAWEPPSRRRAWLCFGLATLGLLIKPPVIVALALFLARPRNAWRHEWARTALWVSPAIAAAGLYYTAGVAFIKSVSDFPEYFATAFRDPFHSLFMFANDPKRISSLFVKDLLAPPYFVLAIAVIFATSGLDRLKPLAKLAAILLLQVLVVAALDGEHSFVHSYYYIGASMTAALMIVATIDAAAGSRWRLAIVALLFVIHFGDRASAELRPLIERFKGESLYAECSELRARRPEFPWRRGARFHSDYSNDPELGLCFGEIQNSYTGRYGFFTGTKVPSFCHVVEHAKTLALVECIPFADPAAGH